MKIGIIGATGRVGQLIMQEASDRGHEVTAIIRNRSKLETTSVSVIEKDILNLRAEDIEGLDVVVNAFGAPLGEEEAHVQAGKALIAALQGTNTKALIVGGAGSLFVDDAMTIRLSETPDFPEVFKATAKGQLRNLLDFERSQGVHWTFLSPSALFDAEGKRTGEYVVGKDHLLTNKAGESYISYADYAIAVLDEIESPQFLNTRFTVVGEKN